MYLKTIEQARIATALALLLIVAATLGSLAVPRLRQKREARARAEAEERRKVSVASAQGILVAGADAGNLDFEALSLTPKERQTLFDAALRGGETASAIRIIRPEHDPEALSFAMSVALERRNATVASSLIRRGISLGPNSHGATFLHNAAGASESKGDAVACAEALIRAGAPLDSRLDQAFVGNATGITPLMIASVCDHPKMVHVLLHAGANPRLRDSEGHTALDLARERRHADVIREFEAKP